MDPIWHDSGMEREWIGVSNEMDLNFKNLWLIILTINSKSNFIFLLERKSIVNNY